MECDEHLSVGVANLLHSRGREVTPAMVNDWATLMVHRYMEVRHRNTTAEQWLRSALQGEVTATMCLHLHFGDALDTVAE